MTIKEDKLKNLLTERTITNREASLIIEIMYWKKKNEEYIYENLTATLNNILRTLHLEINNSDHEHILSEYPKRELPF